MSAHTEPGADRDRALVPRVNPANIMTLLRVLLVPVIAALVLRGEGDAASQGADLPAGRVAEWWATALFIVASVTDTADGWLARRQRHVTSWGKLADPVADKILVLGVLATLAWNGSLPWWVVGVIALRELAVTIQRQYLLRRGVVMPASSWGKVKAVSQMVAITLYIAPIVPIAVAHLVMGIAVILTVISGVEYAFRGARLLRTA